MVGGPGRSGDPGRAEFLEQFVDSVVLGVGIGLGILDVLGVLQVSGSWQG